MKYYYFEIITEYDGMEWIQRGVVEAPHKKEATERVTETDFTHENGIETQRLSLIIEIPKADWQVLDSYLLSMRQPLV